MNDLNVIDNFMTAFITYIDGGFGLLGPDVGFLTTILIGIDITLAGLFWAMGGEDDVIGRFLKKILYVGAFAFIINRFSTLADIIFRSFAGLGLTAGGGAMSPGDLLKPGVLASTGFDAAWPLLDQISKLAGFTTFFDNFLTIAVLLIAWAIVIAAFFILAVQMFITIIEFKLTALAGFVLVPFALWNRTGFLAERVLGNVVSSGVKVMVLAVIVGIGSGYFTTFTAALRGGDPDIAQAMSLVLASLTLFGLGIFGPGIATGLVSGAPQLGAGAAIGTVGAAVGGAALAGGAGIGAARAIGGGALGAIRAGTAMGSAATTAYRMGQETSGSSSVAAGVGGVASVARTSASRAISNALGFSAAAQAGRSAAWRAGEDATSSASASAAPSAPPAWAKQLRAEQTHRRHAHATAQAIRDGDRGGAAANPDIKERED